MNVSLDYIQGGLHIVQYFYQNIAEACQIKENQSRTRRKARKERGPAGAQVSVRVFRKQSSKKNKG